MVREASTNPWLLAESRSRSRTLPTDTNTGVVQEKFSAYDNFEWEKIEAFLRGLFPNWTKYKEVKVNDMWEFEIPRRLSPPERDELENRRDKNRKKRESESPEPTARD